MAVEKTRMTLELIDEYRKWKSIPTPMSLEQLNKESPTYTYIRSKGEYIRKLDDAHFDALMNMPPSFSYRKQSSAELQELEERRKPDSQALIFSTLNSSSSKSNVIDISARAQIDRTEAL